MCLTMTLSHVYSAGQLGDGLEGKRELSHVRGSSRKLEADHEGRRKIALRIECDIELSVQRTV